MKLKVYFGQLTGLQKLCFYTILGYSFIALAANILANDKPWYCKCNDNPKFPIFKSYLENIGLSDQTSAFDYQDCSSRVMTLIPFHSNTLDPASNGYAPPYTRSSIGMHVLGTDALGKDVLAGLIYGTRYAFIIGLASTLFSFIPGLLLGMMMGYWQNHRLRMNLVQMITIFISLLVFVFELNVLSHFFHGVELILIYILFSIAWVTVSYLVIKSLKFNLPTLLFPLDSILMRGIEIFESFPKLMLLMTLTILISRPSIFSLILLIAVIRWPIFAQISRAETLRVSKLNFTRSAENIGVHWLSILTRHIWPNISGTLFVTALFSFSTAILLEASLSFIGLGLKLEQVSWGSLLNEGRQYFPGWWLSFFPGLTIFVLVLALNWLFDAKNKAISV